mmetsp:Transcript_20822/g.59478  ORF Transcript_20822/g.59478 Transcript_20822/m.59478 type:complete len:411 (-) Transcript_20822:53-1285(-)
MRDMARRIHVRVLRHHFRREIDAAIFREPRRGTLAQVHGSVASMRRPRIARRIRIEVERVVCVLIYPARQRNIVIHIPGTLAAAQRNSEQGTFADHLGAGHCRHLAVVDDLYRHAAKLILSDIVEDRHHSCLVDFRRHVGETIAPCCLAVRRHGAGRAAADGLDFSWQLSGGVFHRLDDNVIVVLGVRIGDIPLSLCGIQHLPILDRYRLHIALAQVEGDAASACDFPAMDWFVLCGRELVNRRHGLHRPRFAKNLRHCFRLEGVLPLQGICSGDDRAQFRRAAQGDLETAALPKHVTDSLAHHDDGSVETVMILRKDGKRVAPATTAGALDSELEAADLSELCTLGNTTEVVALAEDEGTEVRVQRRRHAGSHQQVLHRCFGHHGVGHLAHGSPLGQRRRRKLGRWGPR